MYSVVKEGKTFHLLHKFFIENQEVIGDFFTWLRYVQTLKKENNSTIHISIQFCLV